MKSLYEKHRPRSFDDLVGHEQAVKQVKTVLSRGWGGRAWWITGPSGTGKSTLAAIIAREGADELAIEQIDSQVLTPSKLRDIDESMRYRHLGQKPGKCWIVEEAHGLRKDTMRLLLTLLERLPDHVCFVFTTTKAGELSLFEDDVSGDAAPLLSRCIEVQLSRDDATDKAMAERARKIAQAEGIDGLPLSVYENALAGSAGNMRRLLQRIESGAFKADAKAALERDLAMIQSTKGEAFEIRRKVLKQAIASL